MNKKPAIATFLMAAAITGVLSTSPIALLKTSQRQTQNKK
jgi:hypothetical protein